MKQLAIIGPTASGKSDLAIKIALQIDAYILSIDSLSIYKEIDIVSAKPSKKELQSVKHFGINVLNPDEYFSVDIFIDLYKEVVKACKKEGKNLIIVGGTSFYLKSLMQGLSPLPNITNDVKEKVQQSLKELKKSYTKLLLLDEKYMSKIDKNDYLMAMERSVVKDLEIKELLKNSLTDKIDDRELFMRGIDASYFYEGYSLYKTKDL